MGCNPIECFHLRGQHLCKFIETKKKRLHKKGVQLPQNWFGAPTWPPFHCFGTPIWPPWRHVKTLYRVFSLMWLASMQIYWNKRKRLHKKRVQFPEDWFGTPTWPPFHCFGTPIWPPWRHVKTLYKSRDWKSVNQITGVSIFEGNLYLWMKNIAGSILKTFQHTNTWVTLP